MKPNSRNTVNRIKSQYGFNIKKSLGQNFLTDDSIIERIIDSADISETDLVIEIGPGMGALTCEAAECAGYVCAVEIDQNLIPVLEETLAPYDNVEVINSDILKTDINEIISNISQNRQFKRVKIIGNLPYYITTPIIMKILEDRVPAHSITIMMQKEVADRIKANPRNKDYGSLSVAVQYYCHVIDSFMVSKECFYPVPKVDSTVLTLAPNEETVPVDDRGVFFETVKKSFSQRRKTLLNSLTGIRGFDKETVRELLNSADIQEDRRAETLTITEFAALADCISRKIK